MVLRALLLLCVAGCGTIRAAKLLKDAVRPAAELEPYVSVLRTRAEGVDLRVYRPRERTGPLPAILLCHGGSEEGATDPRLVALACALALRGAEVTTPDLASLRNQRIDAGEPARLARIGAGLGDRVALVGISVGGSHALIAATRPELRDRVTCVLTFGAYDDLRVLLTTWLTEVGKGRDIVLRGNESRLVRDAASRQRFLRALRAPVDAETARLLLQPLAADVVTLSPRVAPHAPVFLLHGTNDPIVPAEHSRRLFKRYTAKGASVELLVTDVLEHAGSEDGRSPSLFEAWPLLRFLARFLSVAVPETH